MNLVNIIKSHILKIYALLNALNLLEVVCWILFLTWQEYMQFKLYLF